MSDLGRAVSPEASARKFKLYRQGFEKHGYGRFCVENHTGEFIGYVGVVLRDENHPIGKHNEIGWRLVHWAWGQGYATEAAEAALRNAFAEHAVNEILSYTSPNNTRSQSVVAKLQMNRDPSRDFVWEAENGTATSLLVWKTRRANQ